MDNLDWSLVPSFLAVADEGSLSGASRRLRISQPTLGRHIRSMEASLGYALFKRHPRGLNLSEEGAALIPAARAMAEAAARMSLRASGQTKALEGTIRLTSSIYVAQYLLPPIIARIREAEPLIEVELVASDTSENLLYHEADIALRMYRPNQLDVITRHLGDLPMGLFASKTYLARHGVPCDAEDLLSHSLVGYDRDQRIIEEMRRLGLAVGRHNFATRCDSQTVYWELVRAGCGIGAGQVGIGSRDDTLEQVFPDLPIPPLPVWLTAHEGLRQSPRVHRVWVLLCDHLSSYLS